MSVRIIGEVLDHSEARLSARLVLFALANCADDETRLAYPSADWIARKTKLHRSTVFEVLDQLASLGEIQRAHPGSPLGVRKNTAVWRIREYENSRESRPFAGGDDGSQDAVPGPSRAASGHPLEGASPPSPPPAKQSEVPTVSRGGRAARPGETVGELSENSRPTVGSGSALNARTDETETETELDPPLPPEGERKRDRSQFCQQVGEWVAVRWPSIDGAQTEVGGMQATLVDAVVQAVDRGARTAGKVDAHLTRWWAPLLAELGLDVESPRADRVGRGLGATSAGRDAAAA